MEQATKSTKSPVKQLQKFSKDLLRVNDPTVGWSESEAYCQSLAWGRATLVLGLVVALGSSLFWAYSELRQDPYQTFHRNCEAQGIDLDTCNTLWNK